MNNASDKSKNLEVLIDNELLIPISSACEHISQLGALFRTISGMAGRSTDIKELADLGSYVATDIANWLDCSHESARDEHVPKILAEIRGA
jgi:hypothetical protein